MTGNNKVWRAPLAGLASVAMIATMGVAAATANAANVTVGGADDFSSAVASIRTANNYQVKVYDAAKPWQLVDAAAKFTRTYGTVVTADQISGLKDGQVLDYLSYDAAGTEKVATPYVVTGDVKLYAHYKDAVTVSFDTAAPYGEITTADASVKVAKGTALTADEYKSVVDEATLSHAAPTTTFAGWTTEYTVDQSTSSALYEGGVLNEDTKLYQRWDSGDDVARVNFRTAGTASTVKASLFTLNGKAFPAFRAPAAAGTWQTALEGSAYDFSTPVKNSVIDPTLPDLELVDSVQGSEQNVTVKFNYDYDSSITGTTFADGTSDTVATTAASTIAEPVAPVKANAVFTGWYTTDPKTDKQAVKYDFSKSVAGNFANPTNTVTVYAGWDYDNVSLFVFSVKYQDWPSAQQAWAVYTGKSYDLPKLWEYYQTEAQSNAAKDEFTSRNVTKWTLGLDKVSKATAVDNKSLNVFEANWDGSESVKLDANGGLFGSDNVKWATKTSSQTWADVVTEPTRAGYTFTGWADRASGNGNYRANLVDGYWYVNGVKQTTKAPVAGGTVLYAQWKRTSTVDIEGLYNRFFSSHTAADRTDSIKKVANFGYTEESAAKYVDAVNALNDEYNAWAAETDKDKKAELGDALATKLTAAESLLVRVSVDPSDPSNPFTDVLKGHTPHYSDIIAGYHAGLIQGWQEANGTVTFRPRTEVLRQDYAAFLYRLAGSPEFDVTKATKTFADVDSSTPHYKEILWAASNGVIGGFADGTFRGTDTIQRQDAMEMLYRLAGSPKVEDADKAFTDSSATPFAEAIAWAKAEGVSTGYEDGSFGVGRNIIRQDLAAFLNRAAAVLKK